MMKRVLAFLLVCVVFLGSVSAVAAKVSSPSAAPVEYTLPYPGILPDHPLFAVKMLRDWVFERLITDPLRKTEFYILQSDKRLAMGIAFLGSGKQEQAVKAVSEAQTFMGQAIATAEGLRSSGAELPGHIVDRFERSTAKHLEIVEANSALGQLEEGARGLMNDATALK